MRSNSGTNGTEVNSRKKELIRVFTVKTTNKK